MVSTHNDGMSLTTNRDSNNIIVLIIIIVVVAFTDRQIERIKTK